MTNATTAPDAIAQRARHCLQDSPDCRVHRLQYRDALDAQVVARARTAGVRTAAVATNGQSDAQGVQART